MQFNREHVRFSFENVTFAFCSVRLLRSMFRKADKCDNVFERLLNRTINEAV